MINFSMAFPEMRVIQGFAKLFFEYAAKMLKILTGYLSFDRKCPILIEVAPFKSL